MFDELEKERMEKEKVEREAAMAEAEANGEPMISADDITIEERSVVLRSNQGVRVLWRERFSRR